jgi:hypothetical protein
MSEIDLLNITKSFAFIIATQWPRFGSFKFQKRMGEPQFNRNLAGAHRLKADFSARPAGVSGRKRDRASVGSRKKD